MESRLSRRYAGGPARPPTEEPGGLDEIGGLESLGEAVAERRKAIPLFGSARPALLEAADRRASS